MSDSTPYTVSVGGMVRTRGRRVHAQNGILVAAASFPAPIALLSFGVNIPGVVKQAPLIRSGFLFSKERLMTLLYREDYTLLRIRGLRYMSGSSWLCLISAPLESVKHLTVVFGDSKPLTRFFGIDVPNCEGQKLSREDFLLPFCRCLLRRGVAVIYARSRIRNVKASFSHCGPLLRKAFPLSASLFSVLGNHAVLPLLGEIHAALKLGLVDRIDSGVYADAEFEDFILSIIVITPFLREMAVTAYQSYFTLPGVVREMDAALFSRLQEIGKRVESEMHAATGRVNAHKGAVFTPGLPSADAGLLYAKSGKLSAETALDEVQSLVGDTLRQEFTDLKAEEVGKIHGETVSHHDGTGGVRNAVAKGFPVLRSAALLLLRRYETEKRPVEASVPNVLLHLTLHVSDTNVLYHGGENALPALCAGRRNILSCGGVFASEGIDPLYELRETYKQQNVSPGGVADFLPAALFLHRLEKTFR